MKYTTELLRKEVERILLLPESFVDQKSPEKTDKKAKTHSEISVLKEDDDFGASLFGDVDMQLSKAAKNDKLGTGGEKAELSTTMKLAMVLNRLEVEDAEKLGAFTGYVPRTTGAKDDALTGAQTGTVYSKRSVEKLPGARAEKNDMQPGFAPVTLPDAKAATDVQKKQSAKWLSHSKNRFIISYAGGKLTPTGKAQIEFLARLISNNPLDYKDEKILLKSKYVKAAQSNAYVILYDFYRHALIPIMVTLGNRSKYTPYDVKLDILMTDGLEHALEQTAAGKYDVAMGNYGAWLMKTVKNKAIDYLRRITDFTLDERHVYEMLSAMSGPFISVSSLDPESAHGNFVDAKPNREHPGHWDYVYRDPMDALSDFQAGAHRTEEGMKKSPLQARFLLNPEIFYKGTAKNLTGADIDTEQSYEINTETVIPVPQLPEDAKMQVEIILDKVADTIIANYKEYGIKNIVSSLRPNHNRDLFVDILFALLGYGGMVPVYANTFTSKSGSVYPAGTPTKFTASGEPENDAKGTPPQIKYIWTVRRDFKGDEGMKTDFTNSVKEKATAKYGAENLPQHFTTNPKDFVNKIYGALKYYFGVKGDDQPVVRANKDKLDRILLNYSEALLAETYKIRSIVRQIIMENVSDESMGVVTALHSGDDKSITTSISNAFHINPKEATYLLTDIMKRKYDGKNDEPSTQLHMLPVAASQELKKFISNTSNAHKLYDIFKKNNGGKIEFYNLLQMADLYQGGLDMLLDKAYAQDYINTFGDMSYKIMVGFFKNPKKG